MSSDVPEQGDGAYGRQKSKGADEDAEKYFLLRAWIGETKVPLVRHTATLDDFRVHPANDGEDVTDFIAASLPSGDIGKGRYSQRKF